MKAAFMSLVKISPNYVYYDQLELFRFREEECCFYEPGEGKTFPMIHPINLLFFFTFQSGISSQKHSLLEE
jgi:hypothetical protein